MHSRRKKSFGISNYYIVNLYAANTMHLVYIYNISCLMTHMQTQNP